MTVNDRKSVKETAHVGDPGLVGRVILKCILKKHGMECGLDSYGS